MVEVVRLSAVQQRECFIKGEVSAVELIEGHLGEIKQKEPQVHSFITVHDSLDAAKLLDKKRTAKQTLGKLAGVCVAIKDNICTKNIRTTAGSRILEEFVPSYNATVVEKLLAEDALIIGKTNLDEFAMGSSTEYSAFGPTKNPVDTQRIPGGSSGGSAAAVAAYESPLSLGSDTGGSIRQPASMCGVYGFKPTYGAVSRYGLIAFASSLDQIGPFARTIDDIQLLYGAISGYDEYDSTSARGDRQLAIGTRTRIGIPSDIDTTVLEPDVAKKYFEFQSHLKSIGCELVSINLPNSKYAIETYYVIACAEASSNLARYDGVHFTKRADTKDPIDLFFRSRSQFMGGEVKRRIMLGTYVLAKGYYDAYYNKALKVRRLIKNDFDLAFSMCDLILTPTSPFTAFKFGEKADDPLKMYLCDIFTVTANLAGVPGISVPFGYSSSNLPIGMQLLAPAFSDRSLISFASRIL